MAFRLDDTYMEEPKLELSLPTDLRVLIAGGQDSWQRRLSQLLPDNFSFLAKEALNFDPSILHSKDWLLIYAPSISHALYYRLIAHAGSCRIGYLSKQNPQMSRKEIASILGDEK